MNKSIVLLCLDREILIGWKWWTFF